MSETNGQRAAQICTLLVGDLLDGRMTLGNRLDEASLAGRFGVVRSTMREALKRLQGAGFAHNPDGLGLQTTLPSENWLLQMFEAYAELAADCARLATQRMSPAARRQLDSLHGDARIAVHAGNGRRLAETAAAILAAITAGAGNPVLEAACAQQQARLAPLLPTALSELSAIAACFQVTTDLARAVGRGDGHGAEKAAARLIEQFASTVIPLIIPAGTVPTARAAPPTEDHGSAEHA